MREYYTVNSTKYVISYNEDENILSFIILNAGDQLATSDPVVEFYDDELTAIYRMIELGFNSDRSIKSYTFLLYQDEVECAEEIAKINADLNETYIPFVISMTDVVDSSFLGYIILVDDKVKSTLIPTQISQIMTTESNKVFLSK